MRHMLSVMLKSEGYETVSFDDARRALSSLDAEDPDFILCDIRMPGMDGMGFLKALRERLEQRTVIMMSAYGTVDNAIECMKLGAYDYVSKPFKTAEIVLTLKKAEERERLRRENLRLRDEVEKDYDISNIHTTDPGMLGVLEMVRKVAGYSTSILITGESGTGKELIARAIHSSGERAGRPFVVVNCGAIPAALLESELFGHVKGAFTDAHRNKNGLFQEADGGTLFLDEIGELPLELQVKLLRVLQEGELRRVGDTRAVKVDVRVVAATLRDLKEEIKKGSFRDDLYYRLNVIELKLPPLRSRPGDIPELASHFVEKYGRRFGKSVKAVSKEAMEALVSYSWPGNVRELENVIERAMILEETSTIRDVSLPITLSGVHEPFQGLSIKRAEEELEKELIARALEKTGNNRTKAAQLLEISHRALLYKIKSYGL
ncbi:MAG: sigma-54-dependent Fis family transcriptional regulator [Deltaproteobacteria bacterium]|nr:sigma-54-dependent Fis family transcriptional regulator [Deltaproteobacteria bacterium]